MRASSASPQQQKSLSHATAFPRSHRLIKPAQFQRLFASAQRIHGRGFLLLVCSNGLNHPRLGMAIARKHVRRAVARNRIKRVIREQFRQQQSQFGGVDMVLLARTGADQLTGDALRRTLQQLWRQMEKRCGTSSCC